MSLPYTISAGLSPLLGYGIDRVGRSLGWVLLATIFLVSIHMTLAFMSSTIDPLFTMIWLGVTYSTCAAGLWPMVALLVDSKITAPTTYPPPPPTPSHCGTRDPCLTSTSATQCFVPHVSGLTMSRGVRKRVRKRGTSS